MAYYKDFTVCNYFPREDWLCRLIAVGWIERGKPFATGVVQAAVSEKLRELRKEFSQALSRYAFRGLHSCSICEAATPSHALLDESHVNLFIPHRGFVFVAPGRIDHYIEVHGYQPPDSFMDSVLECPSPFSAAYRQLLAAANRGVEAPFYAARSG